jgi:hypothetical protein
MMEGESAQANEIPQLPRRSRTAAVRAAEACYLRARAARHRALAEIAQHPAARRVHCELAEAYAARAAASRPERPLSVLLLQLD